ncbi:unnamed protein product [Eruca vesicaria subsp. sativa]|uniref:Uncharacterized protein n=1 Tax=Eruca vesicaria subsp. sativa TaxID=29727 RepID=A0ABC8LKX8_ERUVS|nr:unnamed protein product [Eruca vesicaria subsp. sativa]
MLVPEVYVKEDQSSLSQSDLLSDNSMQAGVLPVLEIQRLLLRKTWTKRQTKKVAKEPDVRKTEQEEEKETTEDAENVVEERSAQNRSLPSLFRFVCLAQD